MAIDRTRTPSMVTSVTMRTPVRRLQSPSPSRLPVPVLSPPRIHSKRLIEDLPEDAEIPNQWGDDVVGILEQRAAAQGTTSKLATMRRELKALEVRYFRTRLQLEKVTDKNDQLRQDMTKSRAHTERCEREIAKLRHLIDRIQSEKKQMEAQAITNRDYAKKIEQKFFMGTKGQTLVQCNLELSARIKTLEKTIEDKDAAASATQSELRETQDKLAIVKRALETRFEELGLNGSLHNGILFELAKLQDQNATMALQLGEERRLTRSVQVQLEQARAKQAETDEALVVREMWVASLEKERAELDGKLASSENDRQTLAFEKATLLKFIQEQAEVKFQLEAQLRQVQDAKASEMETWRTKWQLVMDEKLATQQQLDEQRTKYERLVLEMETMEKAWRTEQQTSEELRTRQHELYLEVQRLQDEWKRKDDDYLAAKDVCRELQSTIDALEQEQRRLQTTITELETTVTGLQADLVQKQQDEDAMRVAMENALRDLETVSKQRNEAARAMNEAVTISASSLEEQQSLESKVESQRKQLEQLKHSKNLLQNAMLEQLSALRKQLQTERLQRIEAEAKVKQYCGQGSGRASGASPTESVPVDVALEELQPLPPPDLAMPSPLPPHISMMQLQQAPSPDAARTRPSSASSDSSSSSSTDGQRPRRRRDKAGVASTHLQYPPKRNVDRYQSSSLNQPPSSASSDCGNMSLLDLAGDS